MIRAANTSRIIQYFIAHPNQDSKIGIEIFESLKDSFDEMLTDKHAMHVVESLFKYMYLGF